MEFDLKDKKTLEDRIDQAIFEAEKEVAKVARLIPLKEAKKRLDEKYYKNSI